MRTRFLFGGSGPSPRLAQIVALAALIAVMLPAARVHAKGAVAQCQGVVGSSPKTTVLPASDSAASPPSPLTRG